MPSSTFLSKGSVGQSDRVRGECAQSEQLNMTLASSLSNLTNWCRAPAVIIFAAVATLALIAPVEATAAMTYNLSSAQPTVAASNFIKVAQSVQDRCKRKCVKSTPGSYRAPGQCLQWQTICS